MQARLAQIDLFSENGGMREAGVLRYKEKRRTRLIFKKNFTNLENPIDNA